MKIPFISFQDEKGKHTTQGMRITKVLLLQDFNYSYII